MSVKSLKISVSGVRGIVGEALTPTLVSSFAAAFGQFVGKGKVVVGRDTRITGDMYEKAVIGGLLSVGCQPVLIGVVPTPTVQMAVQKYNACGGIAITASHNPVEWNALKLIGPSGIFLNYREAAELLDVYNQPDRAYVPEKEFRNIRSIENCFDIHKERVLSAVDKNLIKKKRFKVAVDCCNGAGAPYSVDFLEELGCEVFPLFTEVDGIFHRRPEPVPQNLTALSEIVVKNNCDIGFAQDPDADRIVVVGPDGKAIGEQNSIVLAAEHVLSRKKGAVVVNIQTTKTVADIAEKYGCPFYYTPVGEINVTSKMLQEDAVIGGEGGSGGIIYPEVHPCRDSYTGMALILEMMAERDQSLYEIMSKLSIYQSYGVKTPCTAEQALNVLRTLKRRYQEMQPVTIDGLRIDWPDGWVLIRASNTEPIIRIYAEALSDERAEELAEKFVAEINAIVSAK